MILLGNKGSRIHKIATHLSHPLTKQDNFPPERVHESNDPIVMFGACPQKMEVIKECWRVGRPFYTLDSAYLGNVNAPFQTSGYAKYKKWFRLVPNDIQHCEFIRYNSDDRLRNLGVSPVKFKRGNKILVALPGHVACTYHNIDINALSEEITQEIRKYTDREIEFRGFPTKGARERFIKNQFWKRLEVGDIHCTVSWGSVASLESILCGIPTITLRSCVASPVCSSTISDIENVKMPKEDLMRDWLRGISKVCISIDELYAQIRALL